MFSTDFSQFAKKFLFAVIVILGLGLAYALRSELATIVAALIFVALFHPVLTALEKRKIPTAIASLLCIFTIALILAAGFGGAIPLIIEGIRTLLWELRNIRIEDVIALLPQSIRSEFLSIDSEGIMALATEQKDAILGTAKQLLTGSGGLVTGIASGAASILLVVIFFFFFSIERKAIGAFILSLLPKNWQASINASKESIFQAFLAWMRGQMLLSGAIFLMTFLGLGILKFFGVGVSHIFALSLVAGIAECIPYAGPFIALLPALSLALPEGIPTILSILGLYILIQQAENNLLVPFLVGKSLSLSPSFVLVSTMVAFALFGVFWVLVALPFAAAIRILWIRKK